jgi:hypothetical protein
MALEYDDFKDEGLDALSELAVHDLRLRLAIVTQVIREAQVNGDPRWENVVPQQRRINTALVRRLQRQRRDEGVPEPEPVRVAMQPARMVAKGMSPFD